MNKKIRKLIIIISALVILAGIACVAYPAVGKLYNSYCNAASINEYENSVSGLSEEEIKEVKEKAQKYNAGDLEEDKGGNYYSAIDIGEIISYIDIPKINVYIPVYNNTREDTLQHGVGHLENTSLPVGGEGTHCVLTGHSGLTTKEMFTRLEELEIGDEFKLHTLDDILTYRVDDINVVLPEDIYEYISYESGKDYCTLLTCTPIGLNTHRLLVRGSFVKKETAEIATKDESTISYNNDNQKFGIIAFAVLLSIILSIAIIRIKIERKQKERNERNE